jgi:hypothetical protein
MPERLWQARGFFGYIRPAGTISTVSTDPVIREYLARIGRRGGKKGGVARMAGLTAAERRELARKAATARWEKKGRSR